MYLSFISDKKLIEATRKVIDVVASARSQPEKRIFKNSIDPFSGLFDATLQFISIEEWLEQERSRQIQKTFQNAIGQFHQQIIGSMKGWEDLGNGNLVDVRSQNQSIVAEIKNKHNTIKGDSRPRVYDELKLSLGQSENKGFTSYLVEIIPKNKQNYDKMFAPSDNTTHTHRKENENIRIISGSLFYDLASGEKNTLKRLFLELPKVIEVITGRSHVFKSSSLTPENIFDKSFRLL